MSFKFIDLFAGVGGIRLPFDEIGGECVFSSEIDKFARQTYEANYGETPHGDITEIEPKDIPDFDLLLAGFPCQPFRKLVCRKVLMILVELCFFTLLKLLSKKNQM